MSISDTTGLLTVLIVPVGSLPACTSTSRNESAHAVANNCNAACSVGTTCNTGGGGTTHCEVYCNGASWLETGR